MNYRRRNQLAWGILLALSLLLHFWGLGERTFHHDEAVHGHFAFQLALTGEYRYDPTYHGPVLFYIASRLFWILGDTEFSARTTTAIFGVAMLWIAWRLRRPFGGVAAWWIGVLVTISPLLLYYGRFFRNDVLILFFSSAALLVLFDAMRDKGTIAQWSAVGVWSGLAFATKENAYVTVFVLALTLMSVGFMHGWEQLLARTRKVFRTHRNGIVVALSWFVIITILFYTAFFRHPEDWTFAVKAIRHWTEQHDTERVGGPWWYHLFRLIQYEFLTLIAATIWIFRRKAIRPIESGLYLFGVISIVVYANLGEKTPWLGVHQVWAFIPLAGAQLAHSMGRHGSGWSRALALVAIMLTVLSSASVNFIHHEISPANPRVESIHYTQTSPELQTLVADIRQVRPPGGAAKAMIAEEIAWPLAWYLRHENIRWGLQRTGVMPPIVVLAREKYAGRCVSIDCEVPASAVVDIPLRSWWTPDLSTASISDIMRYAILREPWNPVGSSDASVLYFAKETVDAKSRGDTGPD